ncbi:unnamed protein product [Cuscuta epithymum]|uniref:Uncharacterized protein n=1 Tax=Cuscuta epithymum TaxID=186058 RepID=A0AAV0DWL4_9ASTE|nr:unnamed protein product [Cuscuta epithymum]
MPLGSSMFYRRWYNVCDDYEESSSGSFSVGMISHVHTYLLLILRIIIVNFYTHMSIRSLRLALKQGRVSDSSGPLDRELDGRRCWAHPFADLEVVLVAFLPSDAARHSALWQRI